MRWHTSLAYPIIGLVVISVFVTAITLHYTQVNALKQILRATDWDRAETHHHLIRDHINRIVTTLSATAKNVKTHETLKNEIAAFFDNGGFDGHAERKKIKETIVNLGLWDLMDDIVVTDPAGRVIARAAGDQADDILKGWGVAEAASGRDITLTTRAEQGWQIRAASPIYRAGAVIAVLIVNHRLDDRFAIELSLYFDCTASFGNHEGIFASALPPDRRYAIDKDLVMEVLRAQATAAKDLDTVSKTAYYAPLQVVDENFCMIVEKDTGASKTIVAREGRKALLFALVISVAISIPGMFFAFGLIRSVRELKEKAQAMAKEIAQEDLKDIRGNEVVNLVHIFDSMMVTIKRHIAVRKAVETQLEHHRDQLEEQVAERTRHLQNVNDKLEDEIKERIHTETALKANKIQLEQTLLQLKSTQAKMIQSEKMASVGQLAAGVAHEINNPTGYVNSNLFTLEQYQESINTLFKAYNTLFTQVKDAVSKNGDPYALCERITQVETMASTLDSEFILEDMPELIRESRQGAERIQQIVTALKGFAHPGKNAPQDADINDCLETTLKVVCNELKYKAGVTTQYGQLPLVRCNPQQLNQVFVNILVNAAQAIEKAGEIKITTRVRGSNVEISISDTGKGIAQKDLSRIFDPFFTTKEIGKGTGLGLHIAYDIVKSHGGGIDVESTEGRGTTFKISIPVDHSPPINGARP